MIIFIQTILKNNAEYLRNHFSRNRCQQPNKTNDACNDLVSNIVSALHESFLEADGSKQRPLKGWSSYEPVILKETTTTIGVLPISVIGQKIDETTIHRLPLLELTDAQLQEPITETLLAQLIAHPKGLFKEPRQTNFVFKSNPYAKRVRSSDECLSSVTQKLF